MDTQTQHQNHLDPVRKAWVENVSLLFRHKKLILVTTLLVTVGTAVYLFGFAKIWYKSAANVLPARSKGGGGLEGIASGISSTIKDLGITQIAGKGKSDGTYSPLALIQSRVLQEKIIQEFKLMKDYEAQTMEDAVKEFGEHASADVLEEGNISVSFEDTDPERASKIANRLVRGLNETNSRLAIEEAKFNKIYIEQRYSQMMAELDSVETALGAFQKKYGVYELKAQAQAQLATLAGLEQQKYTSEIQLQNALQLYGDQSAETNVLKTQLSELRSKLSDLKTGMDKNASTYFVPMDVLPDVALQYLRLMRDFEILSKLKAFLMPTVEQARLDESRQMLAYIVLDSAVTPTKKSRPKRSIVLLSALLGTFALNSIAVVAVTNITVARQRFRRDKNVLGIK